MKRAQDFGKDVGPFAKEPRFGTIATRHFSTQTISTVRRHIHDDSDMCDGSTIGEAPAKSYFRLFNIRTERLESWPLDDHPEYIIASHTWSENVFPISGPWTDCFGAKGIISVIRERYAHVHYCWFDTKCIDQEDLSDKLEQIPLMDRIFGNATCVVIFISRELGCDQRSVDWLAEKVEGALAMCLAEAWTEEGAYWQSGPGRHWIKVAMEGLLKLASTSWATRIWTLQEYVLAKQILWLGTDLKSIKVDDYALSALPDICNTLALDECLESRFDVLQGYFAGMANARLQIIDQTRIMELPGNRSASVAVDEVYGVMAASGVTLQPVPGETKGQAWSRWCVEAVCTGHLRWALLPASSCALVENELGGCAFPRFSQRHNLSGISSLNTVHPIGQVQVVSGMVQSDARILGHARILRRLGRVHEPCPGRIHRDITLVLFAKRQWAVALKLAWICGGAGLSSRQAKVVAQVLVQSYDRAIWSILRHDEDSFRPMISSEFQQRVWNDFMALQQAHMLGLQEGVGYLCDLIPSDHSFPLIPAMLVTGLQPPRGKLVVIDFDARTPDERAVLMIAQELQLGNGRRSFHKVGMTLPLALPEDVVRISDIVPSQQLQFGGYGCIGCNESEGNVEPPGCSHVEALVSRLSASFNTRLLMRLQEGYRLKMWSMSPSLTQEKTQHSTSRSGHRSLARRFRSRQSKLQAILRYEGLVRNV